MVDPHEVLSALMVKWIVSALEPGTSIFKHLLHHRLYNLQSFPKGRWQPSPNWCLQPTFCGVSGSTLWKRTAKAWKHILSDVRVLEPMTYAEWLSSDFWLNNNLVTIGPGLSHSRAMALYNRGLHCNSDVWVEEYRQVLPCTQMAIQFGLPPTEFSHWKSLRPRLALIGTRLLRQQATLP
jgi:hypothetical protein